MNKNIKAILFISVLSLFCVIFLTFIYQKSRPIIEENEKMDVIENVLYAFDIEFSKEMGAQKIKSIYANSVQEKEINSLLYYVFEKDGKRKYCFPIIAKGAWGMIYGLVSLESDLETIFRVTFTKHQETPGLGALIDEDFYKNRYRGIPIYGEDGTFGIISQRSGGEKLINGVDSITGATTSSNAVVKGINESLQNYLKLMNAVK